MSGSSMSSFNSNNSNISHAQLLDPPRIKKRPRRASSPLIADQSRQEAIINQVSSRNSYLELRDLEPQLVFMNEWIKMKTEVPKIYLGILYANMLASLFTWLVLAGIVVIPVTFASVRNSRALDEIEKAGNAVLGAIQNIPFLWVSGASFTFGVIGLLWLWWENRSSYIWLIDRVFLPAFLNSFIGLVMTLVNVYTIQGGQWSITAIVAAAVTVCLTTVTLTMYIQYMVWTEPAWKEHCAMNKPHVAHDVLYPGVSVVIISTPSKICNETTQNFIGVALLLGAASTNLIWAKAYGIFNVKWTYILSLFLFETGSTVCGAANNMSALIVGRAICGVGGVGMYIGVMTLLSLTTSIHERPNYIASTGIVWALGTVLGPVVGGAFADSTATWRWAFYINLCLGGTFVPVYLFLLPSIDPRPGKKFLERLGEMDILGGILLIGAFVSGIMAISFGGILYPWRSSQIIGCFLVSGTLFILFGVQQAYAILTTNERRIFPVEFLKSRTMVLLFCSMSCASTGLFIPIYMVPLFFQFIRSDTALDAAVRLMPFVLISVFACLVNGAIMSKYGYYMPWYLAAGIFTTVGATLMSIVTENTSTSQIYGSTVLLGFGVGLVLQASFSVAQANVPARKVSDAVGFITCAQVSSLTISLAVANSVFLNEAQNRIRDFLPDVQLSTIQGAIAGVGSKFVATLPDETRYLVLKAIVESMGKVYILGISAGAFLVLLSLGLRRERLFLTVGVIA